MPALTNYKGLQVLSPEPTGDGGLAIQDDLKSLVDWQPKSVWAATADPTVNDDESEDFYPGSQWLRTNVSPPSLFVCQTSSDGAAEWDQILLELAQDTSPQLGGDLDVNGQSIVSTSNGDITISPNGTGETIISSGNVIVSEGRIGVGTDDPARLLHVYDADANNGIRVQSKRPMVEFVEIDPMLPFQETGWRFDTNAGDFSIVRNTSTTTLFATVSLDLLVDQSGNVGIGTNQFGSNASRALAFKTESAPTTSPADSFQMYSADQTAGNAAPHFRTELGHVIKLFQQNHITDPSGGSTQDAEARTAINAILAALENLGLLATS